MKRRTNLTLPMILLVLAFGLPVSATANHSSTARISFFTRLSTDRDQDGLQGPVRRVRTETVKLTNKGGKTVEGQRSVMEVVAYDIKGAKIENAYFPVPGAALTGKEVYKYDDKGNIVEMTLLNTDGTLLSKEVYSYELDNFGNWTKMTTSVAVIEGGKLSYEPTEVTYRMISYYLDEATLAKMSQPATVQPVSSSAPATTGAATQPNPSNTLTAPKPAANSDQSKSVASSKTAGPMPSGGSMVKANMAAADNALRTLGNVASNTAVKVEDEPPPPAIKPMPKPLLKPVSGGVLNGKALVLPKPNYPQTARSSRASGIVIVEVVIDESGKVVSAKATSGHTLLRQAAVQAAQGARFSPTLLSGRPVKIAGEINYNFALAQ
jgi:TonB family protein